MAHLKKCDICEYIGPVNEFNRVTVEYFGKHSFRRNNPDATITLHLDETSAHIGDVCKYCMLKEIGKVDSRPKEHTISWNQHKTELKELEDKMQVQIDALMLEHCPEDMTAEQMERYAGVQKPAE